MDEEIVEIDAFEEFPQLREIPQPPRTLFRRGNCDLSGKKIITIVGSRACTSYGKQVCIDLINGLRGYPVVIASGLALGIDSIAHRAALDTGIPTISFPGSSLDTKSLYPSVHKALAQEIIENGGALYSEYGTPAKGIRWMFPARNRLVAGIADMTIIIEAQERSGTLITARLATEYNKLVGAVPGNITSPHSAGCNWLIRLGAVPITSVADIITELGFTPRSTTDAKEFLLLNEDEERILSALNEPLSRDALIESTGLDPVLATVTLSTLEIKGAIREVYGMIERII
jgi:DNA processing protein